MPLGRRSVTGCSKGYCMCDPLLVGWPLSTAMILVTGRTVGVLVVESHNYV